MAGRKSISQQYQSASNNFNIGGKSINVGIVEHVILNEDDENIPTIGSSEESSKLSDAYIGHSKIRKLNDLTPNKKNLNFYAPMLPDEGIPLVGETVQLIFVGGIDYILVKISWNYTSLNSISTIVKAFIYNISF